MCVQKENWRTNVHPRNQTGGQGWKEWSNLAAIMQLLTASLAFHSSSDRTRVCTHATLELSTGMSCQWYSYCFVSAIGAVLILT
jgi:hypothetical protein